MAEQPKPNKPPKRTMPSTEHLVAGIRAGDRYLLSRAITLVESTLPAHHKQAQEVIEAVLSHTGKSVRVGITGVPGVGKSTFIESLGQYLISKGHRVAVLTVDPSSVVSGGSILGDKTRMEHLSRSDNAYIRPSASGHSVGGVARKTREAIYLCEAAGYDVVLVETVGVGQSSIAVHSMVDFFLLLMLAGAGDELQGMKRGIMEMAHAVAINKADGDNEKAAEQARMEYKRAMHLFPPNASGWQPKVLTCSALYGKRIDTIWNEVTTYHEQATSIGWWTGQRSKQNVWWMRETIEEHLREWFYDNPEVKQELALLEQDVLDGKTSPFQAADNLLKRFRNT